MVDIGLISRKFQCHWLWLRTKRLQCKGQWPVFRQYPRINRDGLKKATSTSVATGGLPAGIEIGTSQTRIRNANQSTETLGTETTHPNWKPVRFNSKIRDNHIVRFVVLCSFRIFTFITFLLHSHSNASLRRTDYDTTSVERKQSVCFPKKNSSLLSWDSSIKQTASSTRERCNTAYPSHAGTRLFGFSGIFHPHLLSLRCEINEFI
jgi:hypothetical protein